MPRPLTLAEARARYPHRYTLEHTPDWAREPAPNGQRYAPQYRSDQEWYDRTLFPGEGHVHRSEKHCFSSNQSWPRGEWLDR